MSWISDYMEYTSKQESPPKFHLWVAIATIGAALGRRVWIERRSDAITRFTVYPGQLAIILVAAPGLIRKSTAVWSAGPFLAAAGIDPVSGKNTPEAFLKLFDPEGNGASNHVVLWEDELSVFLSKATYNEGMIDILMKLADARERVSFNTITRGKVTLVKPLLSALLATTPSSLAEAIPDRAHSAGFMSRFIFIYESDCDRIDALVDVDDADTPPARQAHMTEVRNRLYVGIKRLQLLKGPFRYTPAGKDWFVDHYTAYKRSVEGRGEGWPSRRFDHLLRVAMCLTAQRQDELVLDEEVLSAADKAIHMAELDFHKAFAQIGSSANAKLREKIVAAALRHGGSITSGELYREVGHLFADKDHLRKTLDLMIEARAIYYHEVRRDDALLQVWSVREVL